MHNVGSLIRIYAEYPLSSLAIAASSFGARGMFYDMNSTQNVLEPPAPTSLSRPMAQLIVSHPIH
jgi:hypothetical protein